jgi:hypothetical protein
MTSEELSLVVDEMNAHLSAAPGNISRAVVSEWRFKLAALLSAAEPQEGDKVRKALTVILTTAQPLTRQGEDYIWRAAKIITERAQQVLALLDSRTERKADEVAHD